VNTVTIYIVLMLESRPEEEKLKILSQCQMVYEVALDRFNIINESDSVNSLAIDEEKFGMLGIRKRQEHITKINDVTAKILKLKNECTDSYKATERLINCYEKTSEVYIKYSVLFTGLTNLIDNIMIMYDMLLKIQARIIFVSQLYSEEMKESTINIKEVNKKYASELASLKTTNGMDKCIEYASISEDKLINLTQLERMDIYDDINKGLSIIEPCNKSLDSHRNRIKLCLDDFKFKMDNGNFTPTKEMKDYFADLSKKFEDVSINHFACFFLQGSLEKNRDILRKLITLHGIEMLTCEGKTYSGNESKEAIESDEKQT
jgi:hypothetical protein